MMKKLGLIDMWRHLHPKEKDFTYFSKLHSSYFRIDMFLISGTDCYRATQCDIEPITLSDHAPVILKLKIGPNKQFKYWRANVSLLNKEANQKEIKQAICDYIEFNDTGDVTPTILWERAKSVLRGNIIALSSKLKKKRLAEQIELESIEIYTKNAQG